jgi:hypothetical protein
LNLGENLTVWDKSNCPLGPAPAHRNPAAAKCGPEPPEKRAIPLGDRPRQPCRQPQNMIASHLPVVYISPLHQKVILSEYSPHLLVFVI